MAPVLLALRNLLGATRRTLLLGTALLLVSFLLVLLLALTGGIRDGLLRAATTLASGHVNVAGFYKTTTSSVAPVVTDVSDITQIVSRVTPELVRTSERDRGWGKVVSDTDSIQAGLVGVDYAREPDLEDVLSPSDEARGGAGDLSRLAQPGTMALFESQARRLDVRVGDRVTIRTETLGGQSNTADATVVFIAEDMGILSSFSTLVPRETIRSLYQLAPDTAGVVQLYLEDIDDADAVAALLRTALAERGYRLVEPSQEPFFLKIQDLAGEDWTGQKLDVTTWRDEVSFLTWILTALSSLSIILIAILAVIIAIGVMNTMWIAVRERTAEIGTLRAIGMGRRQVVAMFLVEALALGLVAATLGALLGALAALALDQARLQVPIEAMRAILMSDTLTLSVRPFYVAAAASALSLLVALSALWPASRASRIPPITAIQTVE